MAFSNVCRHHAARVAEGCGVASEFVCPYHSWTYNQEGRLIKATKMKGIQDFTASKIRLTPLRVEQWGPLVFVNHSVDPLSTDDSSPWKRSVSSQLKEVVDDLDAMEYTSIFLGRSHRSGQKATGRISISFSAESMRSPAIG
jgi:phenylpropionate dioxygenase-like ring-hydroxylating dioxygenase large terminal subunit